MHAAKGGFLYIVRRVQEAARASTSVGTWKKAVELRFFALWLECLILTCGVLRSGWCSETVGDGEFFCFFNIYFSYYGKFRDGCLGRILVTVFLVAC